MNGQAVVPSIRTGSAQMLVALALSASAASSTLVGVADWSDYGVVNTAPPTNIFVGTWTHVLQPMGSGQKGNDYPFLIGCSEGFNVICVSGNIGYDAGACAWYYNANTMTATGDHVTVYLHGTETVVRDWVYVAWHFQRNGSRTTTTQYVKLGVTAPMEQVAQETVSELYTPTKVYIGGGPGCWGATYMQYARLYAMSSIPSVSAVNTIAMRTTPDAAAWADWPLISGGTSDVSGNNRAVTISGAWQAGIEGPSLGATAALSTARPAACAPAICSVNPMNGTIEFASGLSLAANLQVCDLVGAVVCSAYLPAHATRAAIAFPAARGTYVVSLDAGASGVVSRTVTR